MFMFDVVVDESKVDVMYENGLLCVMLFKKEVLL